MLMDEIKISGDKHTDNLIGFIDFGDVELNYETLQKSIDVATHVLEFLLCSVVNTFKFSLEVYWSYIILIVSFCLKKD